MSEFSFTATAECDLCGAYLSSSDEACDHDGQTVNTYIFREIGKGRDSMKGVEATAQHKWHALERKVGDDWKKYEWLGTRESVTTMLNGHWETVEDLPHRAMSLDAPRDVGSED